jgi:hypothetical protein
LYNTTFSTGSLYVLTGELALAGSSLNGTGMGCQFGLGKGISVNSSMGTLCHPTGGTGNGYGGSVDATTSSCTNIIDGFRFVLHNYPYISRVSLVQGSGGSGPDSRPGGGAIHIQSLSNVALDGASSILSEGSAGTDSSGSSAGSITVKAIALEGQGLISATGGNGTRFTGGGSGGLVWLVLLSNASTFSGTIRYAGGKGLFPQAAGSNGSFFRLACPPGYELSSNLTCLPCIERHYKGPLEEQCVSCP